jgi:hypothetical protein
MLIFLSEFRNTIKQELSACSMRTWQSALLWQPQLISPSPAVPLKLPGLARSGGPARFLFRLAIPLQATGFISAVPRQMEIHLLLKTVHLGHLHLHLVPSRITRRLRRPISWLKNRATFFSFIRESTRISSRTVTAPGASLDSRKSQVGETPHSRLLTSTFMIITENKNSFQMESHGHIH